MNFEHSHLVSKIDDHSLRNPGKVAITCGSKTVTYLQLHMESSKIAHFLHERIASPNDVPRVLIMLERSPELIISILGILRCGLIFVPIDPGYPENRIQILLKEVKAQWVITTTEYREKFREIITAEKLNVLLMDAGEGEWNKGEITFNGIYNKHCYIYFTSGSTGTPKGVLGRHRSLLHYIDWEIKEFAINEQFRVSQLTNPSFDPFLRDIFVPLAAGGTCCIPENREILLDPTRLIKWLDNQGVNLIHIVPSLFRELSRNIENENCLFAVKYILLAGELLRGNDIKKFIRIFRDRIQLVNIYGPTETTLAKLFYRIKQEDVDRAIIPVGRPIPDTQVMVLDSTGKKCPLQNVGEVYIRTPFISSGYFNDRELSRQVFIKNPFSEDIRDVVYKTGDLGRITMEGNLELVGRGDSQVKIRGVRVELGEIEDLLLSYSGISEAVVLIDEDDDGTKFLVAYLVAIRDITANDIRRHLAKTLPESMIPSQFKRIDKVPLSSNGKVDRQLLSTFQGEPLELETTFVAPGSGLGKIIADTWRDVLKVDRIGVHDNFFDLGGNSMKLIRIHTRLKETLKRDIPVVTLLANPTINQLTEYLQEGEDRVEIDKLAAERQSHQDKKDGIAVIGMAGRFPGAENIEIFWENLKKGMESLFHFSELELEEGGIAPELLKNPNYVKTKGILKDFEYFDAAFFDYSPREAEIMDPQLRILHECAWEALEDAGYNPEIYNGSIGFYSGAASNIYWMKHFFVQGGAFSEADRFQVYTLNSMSAYGTRISYKLDLKGPSFPIHTGCSTSLVTVHLARQGLLNGECDMALAGGVSLSFPPKSGYLYQEGMIHSPDGHCRAFDSLAHGTVFGDAVGLVVLKPLQKALVDGDTIHAIIKGSAINNDGKRRLGYTAPSTQGQAEVISAAIASAGIEPESIGYIEAHGTGTALGDPNEIQALKQAFSTNKRKFCRIGSVKSNMGHLNVAAGITGFIKTVLCLKYKLLLPHLHFNSPNQEIDFENSPFIVNTGLIKWERQNEQIPLRAGISSFGIGGTNAHVILEENIIEPSSFTGSSSRGLESHSPDYRLILLSTKSDTALDQATSHLRNHFETHPDINLADAAYTLQVGRKAFEYRRMLVCSDIKEAIEILSGNNPGKLQSHQLDEEKGERRVAFMFSGQGSQYIDMGLGLYQTEAVFREEMDRCFEILNPLLGYDCKEILYPRDVMSLENSSRKGEEAPPTSDIMRQPPDINQTEIAQPLLFAFEYALAKLLLKWGIKADAMIGHSIGEYVAACLAGVFSLEDALSLVTSRGQLMQQMPAGTMLGISIAEKDLSPLLNEEISLAAVNSPSDCVVSGPFPVMEPFEKQLLEKGIKSRRLHTSHAFHSRMMEPILNEFARRVKSIRLNKPQIPFISNLTGNWITGEEATDPGYWARHIRQTVRFSAGIKKIMEIDRYVFVEVGPGGVLNAFALKMTDPLSRTYMVNLVRHPKEEISDIEYLMERIGRLWLSGVSIDWSEFYTREKRQRISLPTYSFERQRYWIEEGTTQGDGKAWSQSLSSPLQKDITKWFYIPSWKRSILISKERGPFPGSNTWLVFSNENHFCNQVINNLRKEGREVISVKMGPQFTREKDCSYTINPRQQTDYDILLQQIASAGRIPDKIAHLWNVTDNHRERMSIETVDDDQYPGFFSLVYLAGALGKQNLTGECLITVLTDNMEEVTGEERLCPGKSTLLGPVRVIPQEYSNINCRSIDIVLPQPGSHQERKLLDKLMQEFKAEITEPIIAYRGNHRLLQTFEPVPLEKSDGGNLRLRKGGVYLITGGLGGIGFSLARYLAETVQARLILVGRTVLPVKQEWKKWLEEHNEDHEVNQKIQRILELEGFGSEIFMASADVSAFEQMQIVINNARQQFGDIQGVIHAAGLPGGGVIQRKNQEMLESILAPKVKGTIILDHLLRNDPLDFFILCSSRRSIIGTFGQVDYSAANNFLDAFAHDKASRDGINCVSINWGSWAAVGMAHRNEMELDVAAGKSLQDGEGILPTEGVDAFTRILENDFQQVVVSSQDFLNAVEGHKYRKLTELTDSVQNVKISKVTHSRPRLNTSFVAAANQTEHVLVEMWKNFFGFDRIGVHDNFFDLGATSLDLVQLNSRVKDKLGREIPIEKMFTYPTINALAKYLDQNHTELHERINDAEMEPDEGISKSKNRLAQRKRSVKES